jgi:hypothetical protein
MQEVKYYFQIAPYPMIASGGPAPGNHMNLEGAIQNYLDEIHAELRMRQALEAEGGEVDGVWFTDTQLPNVIAQLDQTAKFYPRFFPGAVPAPKTADGIAAQYKSEAAALFASYGY